jgi:hypothetical protein
VARRLTEPVSVSTIDSSRKKRINPTLTIKGFIIYCANRIDSTQQMFDWENALIDAAIISGVTFFSTLAGGAVAGINTIHTVEAATVAAFSQFFVFLALKRGLIQNKEAA